MSQVCATLSDARSQSAFCGVCRVQSGICLDTEGAVQASETHLIFYVSMLGRFPIVEARPKRCIDQLKPPDEDRGVLVAVSADDKKPPFEIYRQGNTLSTR